MLKKLFLPILISAAIGTLVGCNSSSDEEYIYEESSSVAVTAFSILNNPKVLDSLSNVYFSIDLVNAKIFNADSLPYGTKISRLVPSITVATSASQVELKYYCPEIKRDSIVDYRTNSTDSIDFSQGPVKLTVVSESGLVKREYEIRVNVHKQKSDSLMWYSMESAKLPTSLGTLTDQCTAQLSGTYYCLSTDGTKYCLATTINPADPQWFTEEIALPFEANVSSLRASSESLYMLSANGEMYASSDARTWTSTGQIWHYIYGAYGNEIIGCAKAGYAIASYPSGKTWAKPAGFPIEGTSVATTYTLPMGTSSQLVMLGGHCQDNSLCDGAWSFDGSEWAMVSTLPLPTALENVTMVAYKLVEVPSSSWAPYDYPVLLAFGGRDAKGTINRTVYYSRDWGMTWRKAPELVQLPESLPTFYGASAFTHTTTLHVSRSQSLWSEVPVRALPPYCVLSMPTSRAVAPLTQWDCEALYLFGGRDVEGRTLNALWRGVIMQFTYVPIQ